MNTKRLIALIISLILAFSVCLALASCGGGDEPTPPTVCTSHADSDGDGICDTEGCNEAIAPCTHADANGDGSCDECGKAVETEPEDGIALVKDGVPKFQFVIQSGLYSDVILRTDNLISTLNERLVSPVHRVDDRQDNHAECEVILGTARYRDAKYSIDGHDYGYGGYAIKLIDKKIIIVGGSDEGLLTAFELFCSRLLSAAGDGPIDDLYIDESITAEKRITDYPISSITIAGRPLSDFVIVADKSNPTINSAATALKDKLYLNAGVWLDIKYPEKVSEDTLAIRLRVIPNTGEGNGYRVFVDEHGSLVFECEFISSFEKEVSDYVSAKFFPTSTEHAVIGADEVYTKNLRDIFYADFGAVGDGKTDDFFAIKAAHDKANADGHVVHADPDATYYLGKGSGANTITVMTDTYWHGCKFIFDDHEIAPKSDEYYAPVFSIASEHRTRSYSVESLPITSISQGATNIGFEPGFRAMVTLRNENVMHYIRYGNNKDNGNAQQEFVMVDADGTIDSTTPIQWDYDVITKITVKCVEDEPIVVDGGGEYYSKTLIETIFNGAPSQSTYYQRNIKITRSNATVKNVEHIITGEVPESKGGTGAPYIGFTEVSYCEKSTVEGFIFQRPLTYYTTSTGGVASLGTYEMGASYANSITWKNCKQSNFFETDGSVKYNGTMGTNYCRNLTFDGMFTCSFDAHKAAYNATIKNSTVEHLNFIGEGTIRLENVTVYAESTKGAIVLRTDYGSTWEGELIVDGLDIRYSTAVSYATFGIIKAEWRDHDFGYTCFLPELVSLKNVTLSCYSYKMVDGNRTEQTVSTNAKTLWLVTNEIKSITNDISRLTGDGGSAQRNPYVGTKKVVVEDCGNLNFRVPDTPLFADTELWVNGTKQ